MFLNYRKIQRLSVEAERYLSSQRSPTMEDVDRIYDRYNDLLDESENHTTGDYLRHFPIEVANTSENPKLAGQRERERKRALRRDWIITFLPYGTLIIPALLIVPLAKAVG